SADTLVRGAGGHPATAGVGRFSLPTAIPANGPDVLCDDDVGGICWRFDLNLALMSIPKRPNLSAGGAENPPQASSWQNSPVTRGNRQVVLLTSQTDEQRLRRIREDHRAGRFE